MSVLGALTIKIVGDISQFNKDIAKVQKQLNSQTRGLQTVAKSMTKIGDTLTKSVTLPIAGLSVVAVKSAADFETSMRNVNSISKMSESQFAEMSKKVVDLSKKLPQSAKTLADGLYDISSSGFQGAEGLKVLEAAAKAASAGMTDTATSAKGITAVLNAYGLEADAAAEISDTMFKTVDKGVISFEELSGGIGNVVSTSKLAGISINELSGMIAYMTTKGVSADETMTALNRLIMSIIDPSEELAAVLKKAGYESGEMAIKQLGLVGVMELMEEATGGSLTELQKLSPEMRALKASGALLGGGIEELNNYMADFKDTTGSTNAALEEQSKSLQFQLDVLKNNLLSVAIGFGDIFIPVIKDAVKAITPLINKLADLSDENKKSIVQLGLLLVAIGPVLSITGRMITNIIELRKALVTLNVATKGLFFPVTAFLAFNGIVDISANKIDDLSDSIGNDLLAELLRLIAPLTAIKEGMHDNIGIAKALAQGYLTVDEAARVNIFTVDKYQKIIAHRMAAEKKISEDTLPKFIQKMDALDKSMGQVSLETLKLNAIQKDNEAIIKSIQEQYGYSAEDAKRFAENQGLLKEAINETTESAAMSEEEFKELQNSVDKATEALSVGSMESGDYIKFLENMSFNLGSVNGGFEALINNMYRTFNINYAVEESTQRYEEALKKLKESIASNTVSEENRKDMIAQVAASMKTMHLDMLVQFHDNDTTIEQQKEIQKQFALSSLEAVNYGITTAEEAVLAAKAFGLSSTDIIKFADDMGIKLDWVTRERFIHINHNMNGVESDVDKLYNKLKQIDGMNVTFKMVQTGLMGWASGGIIGYKEGGIINKVLSASSGMITPSYDNGGILSLLHKNEVVLNSGQQRNLAEFIFGLARTKHSMAKQPNNDTYNININGAVIKEDMDIRSLALKIENELIKINQTRI